MLCIGPILENSWFYLVKSTILQKSTFGIYAQLFGISQWFAPCWKASGQQFVLFLNDRWEIALQLDFSRILLNFGTIFRSRTLKFRLREGLSKHDDFSLIVEPYFFRFFSILVPQGGPQEGPKFWLPRAFYDILASQSPSRGPVTIFNRFLTFFIYFSMVFQTFVDWLFIVFW